MARGLVDREYHQALCHQLFLLLSYNRYIINQAVGATTRLMPSSVIELKCRSQSSASNARAKTIWVRLTTETLAGSPPAKAFVSRIWPIVAVTPTPKSIKSVVPVRTFLT